MLHGPNHRYLQNRPEHERDAERREERAPVGQPPLDELVRDVRRQHRELALREVDDVRRLVDEDEREGKAAVDHPERDSLHRERRELRAVEAADEEEDRAGEQEGDGDRRAPLS